MARRTSIFLLFVIVIAVFFDMTLASSWLFGSDKGTPTIRHALIMSFSLQRMAQD